MVFAFELTGLCFKPPAKKAYCVPPLVYGAFAILLLPPPTLIHAFLPDVLSDYASKEICDD